MIKNKRRRDSGLSSVWILPLVLSMGCGDDHGLHPPKADQSLSADSLGESEDSHYGESEIYVHADLQIPPREYYDALLEENLRRSRVGLSLAGDGSQVLFLNFGGATVSKGFAADQSFIPCKQTSTIPAADLSPQDIETVVGLVQGYYDAAGAALTVTTERPQSGSFSTMHVGGRFGDLGCTGRGVLGVAPFDVGNANPQDVGFAFTANVSSLKIIAETIAHEAGHSFGLDHINNDRALMYFSSTPFIEGFASGQIRGSNRIQNSVQVLQTNLGNLNAPPVAALPVPAPAPSTRPTAPVPAGNLPGLDQLAGLGNILPNLPAGLGGIDLSSLTTGLGAIVPGLNGGALPGLDQILAGIGMAGNLGNLGGVGGLGGLAGLDLSGILGSLGGIDLSGILGGTGGLAAAPGIDLSGILGGAGGLDLSAILGGLGGGAVLPGGLPDLSALLGLGTGGALPIDLSQLLSQFNGSLAFVQTNYSGQTATALTSLLQVAYSQQYAKQVGNTP